jgi:hypothetical protein
LKTILSLPHIWCFTYVTAMKMKTRTINEHVSIVGKTKSCRTGWAVPDTGETNTHFRHFQQAKLSMRNKSIPKAREFPNFAVSGTDVETTANLETRSNKRRSWNYSKKKYYLPMKLVLMTEDPSQKIPPEEI